MMLVAGEVCFTSKNYIPSPVVMERDGSGAGNDGTMRATVVLGAAGN